MKKQQLTKPVPLTGHPFLWPKLFHYGPHMIPATCMYHRICEVLNTMFKQKNAAPFLTLHFLLPEPVCFSLFTIIFSGLVPLFQVLLRMQFLQILQAHGALHIP
jgi:hypothetical protein